MFITDKEVQRVLSNARNHQIAKQYYYNDCVNEIYITYNDKTQIYKIKATTEVRGSETFSIIEVNQQSKVVDYQCNCYWCDEYAACPHIGAILFKVQELSPETYPFHYKNDRESKRKEQIRIYEEQRKQRELALQQQRIELKEQEAKKLIAYYKEQINTVFLEAVTPASYKIYTNLEMHYNTLITKFKVGSTHKYIIKNITTFLQAITNKEEVTYGKNLTFKHDRKVFDEASILQLDFMVQGLSLQKEDEYRNVKELYLDKSILDIFYDTYIQVPVMYRNFKTVEIIHHPKIQITKFEHNFRLTLEEQERYLLGNKHVYCFEGNVLGRITLDDEGKVANLLQELSDEGEILVHQEDFKDFYAYVLSDIKEYIEILNIELPTIVEEGNIVLYGDIDEEERICVSLEYEYENGVKKQGFDTQNSDISMLARKVEGYIGQYATIDEKTHTAYMNSNDNSATNFIQLGLPFLSKHCDIYVSDALKQVGTKSSIKVQVGVTVKNDLLAIDIDSVDIPKEELAAVLDAYKRKKKFYKLPNGELLYLESDSLAEVDNMLDLYNVDREDIENGSLSLDLYRAFSMESFADTSENVMYNRSDIFKDLIQRFSTIEEVEYPISSAYENILRDYQRYGYQWLQTIREYGFGGILADDMGLGKTLQVISVLDSNRDENRTSIVICPSSLILNWEDEIHKFSDSLRCKSIHGTVMDRKDAIASHQKYDVLITSYDYIRRDVELYEDISFFYIILDEAQYIKNPKTKNAMSVKQLQGQHRLALTGTPIENSLAELWSIFDFLMQGYLYNYRYFQREYETPIVREKDEERQLDLQKLISPFILRRTKKEVLKELPDKIEQNIPIEFNEEERKLYIANLSKINTELQTKLEMDKVGNIEILAMLTKLRQICCEPRVAFEGIENPSSKLQACLEIIRTLKENNKKVLLFSSFTSVLDLVAQELQKEKISYYSITGSVKKETRRELVNQFQEDDTTVFLISLKAGGTGLNLTAAEAVIHFDPWWNVSAQNQATDRAYRIGQTNTVQVFKLIMKDSIEEKIQELQEKKKDLSDTFVEGNTGNITSMSANDLIDLFSMQ